MDQRDKIPMSMDWPGTERKSKFICLSGLTDPTKIYCANGHHVHGNHYLTELKNRQHHH